jgi:hypothetical protein
MTRRRILVERVEAAMRTAGEEEAELWSLMERGRRMGWVW